MKKLLYIIVFTLVAVATAQAFGTGYETFEDLVSAMEHEQTDTSNSQFGNIIMHSLENPKQDREWARQEISAVKKNLRFHSDKIENKAWVFTKLNQLPPCIDFSITEEDGGIWLIYFAKPKGKINNALLVEQIVLNIDGQVYNIEIEPGSRKITTNTRTERSALGGLKTSAWHYESVGGIASPSTIDILNLIPHSNVTMVRLRGQNSIEDFTFSSASKNALGSILRYYKARQIELQ